MQPFRFLLRILPTILMSACSTALTATSISLTSTVVTTETSQPTIVQTDTVVPTVSSQVTCDSWQSWPVVPAVSEPMRALYQRGQANGNNPRAFSKIGDGEVSTAWFLTAFDVGQDSYDLGPYREFSPTIEYFQGSFERIGMAARRGFNTVKILDARSADPGFCESGESPLACELRLHQPSFVILSLGTNQVWRPEEFGAGMRQILDILISKNVVPILSTKGDNLEGDYRINRTIACLAEEYDVPLWNFWAAIQPLPNHGLQPDLEHLTYGITDFDDNRAMQSAWTIRNLTALQVLEAIWKGVTGQP